VDVEEVAKTTEVETTTRMVETEVAHNSSKDMVKTKSPWE